MDFKILSDKKDKNILGVCLIALYGLCLVVAVVLRGNLFLRIFIFCLSFVFLIIAIFTKKGIKLTGVISFENNYISFVSPEWDNIIVQFCDINRIDLIYKDSNIEITPILSRHSILDFRDGVNSVVILTKSGEQYKMNFLSEKFVDDVLFVRFSERLKENGVPYKFIVRGKEYTNIQ
jgi:hypothetical protein